MREDEVFTAIADLVAAGEYLDEIDGLPGVDLDGARVARVDPDGSNERRIYRRGSRRFLEARARGWIVPLPPLRPAPQAAVEEAEERAGAPLPTLLRRIYLEVANGGFGPGYGLLGLRGGHRSGGRTATDYLRPSREGGQFGPSVPFWLCDWGCGITSEIDLADGQIWGSDPNPGPPGVPPCFPQGMTITDWFGKWLDGRLYQPWLREDPVTGQWRGATDAETQAELEEFGFDEDDG